MTNGDDKIILLVEDEPDDQLLLQHALDMGDARWKLVVVDDGTQALDYLFTQHSGEKIGSVALVLLDLKIPKVSGLEVLAKLRAKPQTQFLPVVVFTSSVEQNDLEESYRLGCNGYVRKPVDFHRFAETVRQVASFWLGLNELPQRWPGFRLHEA